MPFKSRKQQRFLFARHPGVAKKFVRDARRGHKPIVQRKAKRRRRK